MASETVRFQLAKITPRRREGDTVGIFEFIVEHRVDRIFDMFPTPRPPRWVIEENKAVLGWDQTIAWLKQPSKEKPGQFEVHMIPPPPIEDVIDFLYTNGWKRGGWHEDGDWRLYAYVQRDDMEIRIKGSAGREHPDKDEMRHFYAPPPPKLPTRSSAKFKAEYEEYWRKCREDEW
jgi:hypothetical protein